MDPFRLLCYNVRGFPWFSLPIQEMVTWMTANADIVALQEVWNRHSVWSAAFAAAGWTFQRPPREHQLTGLFGSGLAIAWRSSDWIPTEDARFYPFLAVVGLDQFANKGWLRVELRNRKTGIPLRLINTHMQSDYEICDELWQHISDPIRMAQAREITTVETRMPPVPTLFVGDFNTDQCWLPGAHFLNPCTTPTFPSSGKYLDHIATWSDTHTTWRLLSHEVAVHRTWSDHLPIRWVLSLTQVPFHPEKRLAQVSQPAASSVAHPES